MPCGLGLNTFCGGTAHIKATLMHQHRFVLKRLKIHVQRNWNKVRKKVFLNIILVKIYQRKQKEKYTYFIVHNLKICRIGYYKNFQIMKKINRSFSRQSFKKWDRNVSSRKVIYPNQSNESGLIVSVKVIEQEICMFAIICVLETNSLKVSASRNLDSPITVLHLGVNQCFA